MAKSDRSSSRLPLIAGVAILVLALLLGGGFLRLGMTAVPPEQVQVHKELSAAQFAPSAPVQAPLPAMPPVSTGTPATLTPATPLPTMPAPKPAPSVPAAAGH